MAGTCDIDKKYEDALSSFILDISLIYLSIHNTDIVPWFEGIRKFSLFDPQNKRM